MRFKQGEEAKFVVAIEPVEGVLVEKECVIEAVGPFKRGELVPVSIFPSGIMLERDLAYIASFPSIKVIAGVQHDWQLQKKTPPAEPKEMHHDETIDEEIEA